ncbi:hypothetical protein [Streptomyces phaeochromogenes]
MTPRPRTDAASPPPPSTATSEAVWRVNRLAIPGNPAAMTGTCLREDPDGSLSVTTALPEGSGIVFRPEHPVWAAVYQRFECTPGTHKSLKHARARRLSAQRQPDLVTALNARNAALSVHGEYYIDQFASGVLLGKWSERSRRAVSTALLGDWVVPLTKGRLGTEALGVLRSEARTIYRQELPLWMRGTRKGRLLSLDAPVGDGLSLYDLLGSQSSTADLYELVFRGLITDRRLVSLLKSLKEDEASVLVARAEGPAVTWPEAAASTGAADPAATGERVRRKVIRLADEHKRRAALRSENGGEASL